MRANALLKHNIDALLRARGHSRKDLAQWCRRTESWISKIFRSETKELPLKYADRIADFFGVETYQLLQPGIGPLTERRRSSERRSGTDRRIGHEARELRALAAHVAQNRRPPHGRSADVLRSPPDVLHDILKNVEQQLHEAIEATKRPREDRPAESDLTTPPKGAGKPARRVSGKAGRRDE